MNKSGPIVVVDDDSDDLNLLKEAFQELRLPNQIYYFNDPVKAFEYLINNAEPFFCILCDINMPKMNGFELRRKIIDDNAIKQRTIPFIYLTTANAQYTINTAYDLDIQGFFVKPAFYNDFVMMLDNIIGYWKNASHPTVPKAN